MPVLTFNPVPFPDNRKKGITTDGPQVAILRPDTRAVIAASPVVSPGSHDWQPLVVDFIAPADTPPFS